MGYKRELDDTIVAPITAPGRAAISVIRISGPRVKLILEKICNKASAILATPRNLIYTKVFDLTVNPSAVLDHALVCFFPGPHSFTGQDVAEINLHGSPFIVKKLLEVGIKCGARLAEPGEFSERAFLNGKIDLTQAEAIADLINSETEAQAKIARDQLEGKLSQAISNLGDPLRNLLAEIEAYIDFPEEDIQPLTYVGWNEIFATVCNTLKNYIFSYYTGKLLRDGADVAIIGAPNAGKSSLLNKLVGKDRAIVTPIPGTTRDSIEEWISIDGLQVRLWDTAGVVTKEQTNHIPDQIEELGIKKSWKHAENADLVIFLYDATTDFSLQKPLLDSIKSKNVLIVGNKIDLVKNIPNEKFIFISAMTGEGINQLLTTIKDKLINQSHFQQSILICNQRHLNCLENAYTSLNVAIFSIQKLKPPEIIALEIRSALSALTELIGVTENEDILGRIFSKFCIGK